MKKLLAILMLIAILAIPTAIPIAAVGENAGAVPLTADAISVDGMKDKIYDKGLIFPLDKQFASDPVCDSVGTAYVLRDETTLYIFVEITGEKYYKPLDEFEYYEARNAWFGDGVELSLNRYNNGDMDYDTYDYRISVYGIPSVLPGYFDVYNPMIGEDETADEGTFGFMAYDDLSYSCEFAIPLKDAGNEVSLFIFFQDWQEEGYYKYACSQPSGTETNYVTLDGPTVSTKPIVDTDTATDADITDSGSEDVGTTEAPQTFDIAVVSAITAVVTLIGATLTKKRRS